MSEYSQSKVTKTVKLDLSGIPESQWAQVKREIKSYLEDAILDKISQGQSPVKGMKEFPKLKESYAKAKKGGDRTPNLNLEGDLWNSIKAKSIGGEAALEVGVFRSKEAPKAFNHNEGDTLPTRRFIPKNNQAFSDDIMSDIRDIIEGFRNGEG